MRICIQPSVMKPLAGTDASRNGVVSCDVRWVGNPSVNDQCSEQPRVNVHGLLPGRATRDIDFRIAVESWAQFELLKERLLATNDFSASRAQQRLTFTDSNEGVSIPVDLIPFRGVASADGTIAWATSRTAEIPSASMRF